MKKKLLLISLIILFVFSIFSGSFVSAKTYDLDLQSTSEGKFSTDLLLIWIEYKSKEPLELPDLGKCNFVYKPHSTQIDYAKSTCENDYKYKSIVLTIVVDEFKQLGTDFSTLCVDSNPPQPEMKVSYKSSLGTINSPGTHNFDLTPLQIAELRRENYGLVFLKGTSNTDPHCWSVKISSAKLKIETIDGEELSEYEETEEEFGESPEKDSLKLDESDLQDYEELWINDFVKELDIGKITTQIGEKSFEEILSAEVNENKKEGESFMFRFVERAASEGPIGSFIRWAASIESPFTYNAPTTTDFFNKVGKVGGDELQKIQSIYSLVTETIPDYGTAGSDVDDFNKISTFEEVLSNGKGICREQAAILNSALRRKGIESKVIGGDGHVWVRLKLTEGEYSGKEFDLDPTWYKDFVPLPVRK